MSDFVPLSVGFICGIAACILGTQISLSDCREQHNVYECKVIAVPVEVVK